MSDILQHLAATVGTALPVQRFEDIPMGDPITGTNGRVVQPFARVYKNSGEIYFHFAVVGAPTRAQASRGEKPAPTISVGLKPAELEGVLAVFQDYMDKAAQAAEQKAAQAEVRAEVKARTS